jgi:adenylyltransferase/sulfurtransferase
MKISDLQIERYARHILLPEIGGAGQTINKDGRVLVIGAGGLGSPVLLYLAAAGVGTIGIIDDDKIELSNLQRQIIHTTPRVGKPKVESARDAVETINPDVKLQIYEERFTADNAFKLLKHYDIVADGSDNFETRFLVNDACYLTGTTLVSAAILRFDAQLGTYKAHLKTSQEDHPCYRCIFPEAPPADTTPSCAEAGVLGALCGVVGSLQATEILKELTGAGTSLSGYLLIIDGLGCEFRKIKVNPDPDCALCGIQPTIKDLSLHT